LAQSYPFALEDFRSTTGDRLRRDVRAAIDGTRGVPEEAHACSNFLGDPL
jgi:hypothetical protein